MLICQRSPCLARGGAEARSQRAPNLVNLAKVDGSTFAKDDPLTFSEGRGCVWYKCYPGLGTRTHDDESAPGIGIATCNVRQINSREESLPIG